MSRRARANVEFCRDPGISVHRFQGVDAQLPVIYPQYQLADLQRGVTSLDVAGMQADISNYCIEHVKGQGISREWCLRYSASSAVLPLIILPYLIHDAGEVNQA